MGRRPDGAASGGGRRLAGLGFLGIALPEEHGGSGVVSLIDALIVIEELAKAMPPRGLPGLRGKCRAGAGDRVLRHRRAARSPSCPGS